MPELRELNFDTGLVTYSLNGKCEVTFNATDMDFCERLFNVFDTLERKQSDYEDRIAKMADKREGFLFMRERDAEMREQIDSLFDASVCAAAFGRMNVFALADGLPVWCNLMFAVMDQIDNTFAREQKATNPRIQKYTDKWKKK